MVLPPGTPGAALQWQSDVPPSNASIYPSQQAVHPIAANQYAPHPLQYVQPVPAMLQTQGQGLPGQQWFVYDPNIPRYYIAGPPQATSTTMENAAATPPVQQTGQTINPPPEIPVSPLKGTSARERVAQLERAGIPIALPPEGQEFPERHMADPADYLRTVDEDAKRKYIELGEKPKLILHTAGQLQKKDINDKHKTLTETVKIVLSEADFEITLLRVPGDDDDYVDTPTPWMIHGLSEDGMRVLAELGVWSTPWITFFVVTKHDRVPNFVARLQGFKHNYRNTVEGYTREVIRGSHFVEKLAETMSKDAKYTHQDLEAARKYVDTIDVVPHGEEEGDPVSIDIITATPPTTVIFKWKAWRDYLKECLFLFPWNTPGEVVDPPRCRECHGVGHIETACPFMSLPGWHPMVEVRKPAASTVKPRPTPVMVHRNPNPANRPPIAPQRMRAAQEAAATRGKDRSVDQQDERGKRMGGKDGREEREDRGSRRETDRRTGEGMRDARHDHAYHPYPQRYDRGEGSSRSHLEDDRARGKRLTGGRGNRG
ncbi:hypothetical protein C8Q70DRAFT_1058586 [Cubamyces menziesii]|nr:hypothetical protein C8Q70DRAFT_1058586 [Cubamyces menziesii]